MYSEQTWSNKVLIPFCVIQMILEFITIGALAELIAEESGSFNNIPPADIGFLVCAISSLVVEPLTMLLKSYTLLKPWLFVLFQVFKALFASAFVAVELSRYFKLHEGLNFSNLDANDIFSLTLLLNAGLGIAMALSFYASLAYGIVVLHRHRKRDNHDSDQKRGPFDS